MNCKESPISALLRAVYNRGSDGYKTLSHGKKRVIEALASITLEKSHSTCWI